MTQEIEPNNLNKFLPDTSDHATRQRRKWVLDQYLALRMPYEIRQEWLVRYPNLSERSFDKDVEIIYKQIDATTETAEETISKHIQYYYDLAKDLKDKNPKLGMIALNNIERLKKLHAPTVAVQINNNGSNQQLDGLSLDDIKALLEGNQNSQNEQA